MSSAATEPSVSEVEQSAIPDIQSVPVIVQGPVNVRELPSTAGSHGMVDFASATDVKLVFGFEPRRRRLVLMCVTDAVWIGVDQQTTQNKRAFRLGSGQAIVITHIEEIWAMPDVNGSALLSYIQEIWTD